MFKVELLKKAEYEISDAYDWYEEQQISLGNKFYHEVKHYLKLIERSPFHFPVKYSNGLCAASLKKFPYLIIYWVDEVNEQSW